MSAASRGSAVISQEFYPTPSYTTESILKELDLTKVNSFREPCKGGGHIYNLINVPNKDYFELSEGKDYLKGVASKVDLILTNPPFSLAQEFITKARTESDTVIMLQRINYLGSATRKDFWNKNPPTHLFVLANRPKFIAKCTNNSVDKTNKKKICVDTTSYQITSPASKCISCGRDVKPCSDATEYAWFVWDTKSVVKKKPGIYVI